MGIKIYTRNYHPFGKKFRIKERTKILLITLLQALLYILRFSFGACIFSFLNVVIYRLPTGESITRGRSHCPGCNRTLTPIELIPCLSYLLQNRRCRGCKMKISGRYFAVECFGGAAFLYCGAFFGYGEWGILSLRALLAFTYLGVLTVIAFIDWDTRIIYDRFHIIIILLGIAAVWLSPEHTLPDRLIGAVIVSLPMLGLALAIAGAFGGGDIKLMAASGWLLGWRAMIPAIFLGLITGGCYCIWMLARKKMTRKDHFAFGPFLALGLGAAFFYGDEILRWYLAACNI